MKISIWGLWALVCITCTIIFGNAAVVSAEQKENESSTLLIAEAWKALDEGDMEAVLRWTNRCIELYGDRADQMQEQLGGYVNNDAAEIRSHWALNDVATALFIQGKAYQLAGMYAEAKASYKQLMENYSYGQCWEPKGWFWKPAEVAKDNLDMIDKGLFLDFGDYSSATLVAKAWKALKEENLDLVKGYADQCILMYQDQAKAMQKDLKDFPVGDNEELNGYWALNDVATAHFIKGRAYMVQGKSDEALHEFETVHNEYSFGQCWDPRGWFWKPSHAAKNWIEVLGEKKKTEDFLFTYK